MNCPNCQNLLKKINFRFPDKDYSPEIFYCPRCGGFWLDSLSANNLTFNQVKKFHQLFKIPSSYPYYEIKNCPRCHLPLKILEEESVPPSVVIFFCPKCNKKWFPSGNLIKFKKAQQAKLAYIKEWKIPLKSVFAVLLPIIILAPMIINFKKMSKNQPSIYLNQPISGINFFTEKPKVEGLCGNRIKISFSTSQPFLSQIEYGLEKENLLIATASNQPTTFHQVILNNLLKNQNYWFRMVVFDQKQKYYSPFYIFIIKNKNQ